MYHAAVCEDEREIASYIMKTLANEFQQNNVQVEFDLFYNGNQLLSMMDNIRFLSNLYYIKHHL